MKKTLHAILIIIGGILIMTVLNGCELKDPSLPENRTEKEYEFENTFQPFFDFLAADKKDLSTATEYSSYFLRKENPSSPLEFNKIDLELVDGRLEGSYSIGRRDSKNDEFDSSQYKVSYVNNTLEYQESVPQEYDMDLFSLQIPEKVFRDSPIISMQKDHPETILQKITYKVSDELDIVKEIRKKYNMKDKYSVFLTLTNKGYGDYTVTLAIESDSQKYSILNQIDFKENGEE